MNIYGALKRNKVIKIIKICSMEEETETWKDVEGMSIRFDFWGG
jgi:hypothetical protein